MHRNPFMDASHVAHIEFCGSISVRDRRGRNLIITMTQPLISRIQIAVPFKRISVLRAISENSEGL